MRRNIFHKHRHRFPAALFLFLPYFLAAQVDIESVAKFYFSLGTSPSQWLDGCEKIVSGSYSPYPSHRSGSKRDSAYVARTSGSESSIVWESSAVPKSFKAKAVSFIWSCGFGNNLGEEWFDLIINDSITVPFSTKNDPFWSVGHSSGVQLSFTAIAQNSYGANLGYMVLTMPQEHFRKGQSVNIRLQGRLSSEEIWYRIYPMHSMVRYIHERELRPFYTNMSFIHMGDARVEIYAPKKISGVSARLLYNNSIIGEGKFIRSGEISKNIMIVPRSMQPNDTGTVILTAADKIIENILWKEIHHRRLRAFMDEEIAADRYVFPPGDFPKIHWVNEVMVENEMGPIPLTVEFYDKSFHKVAKAQSPGRYGAVITGKTAAGYVVRRYLTLFCSPVEFDDYSMDVPVRLNSISGYGIRNESWEKYNLNLERFSFGDLKYFPQRSRDAAIVLAGLIEMDSSSLDTPRIKDRQWWITLKRKMEGRDAFKNPLRLPRIDPKNRMVAGLPSKTSMVDSNKVTALRSLCREWSAKSGVPHSTIIIYKGDIIFNESFGSGNDGEQITNNTRMWMASLTKLLTGFLMMQFVDQGLVDLDDPVGTYLHEFKGNTTLTVRHLFTHSSGLHIAGEWASDWNQSLENQIAHLLPSVEVGKSFSYHRVGYAVAGKIMERLTGRAVPYLFTDYVFGPLGMTSAYSDNTYGGLYCTAGDLAVFGQMLINKGDYGGSTLISAETWKQMLPMQLPVLDRRWGIGTSPMSGIGMSNSAFGHGAASGSILRIDPENELVIISCRNTPGPYHGEYEKKLMERTADLIHSR